MTSALLCLIFVGSLILLHFSTYTHLRQLRALPDSWIYLNFNVLIAPLYINSVLANLNARSYVRGRVGVNIPNVSGSLHELADMEFAGPCRHNIGIVRCFCTNFFSFLSTYISQSTNQDVCATEVGSLTGGKALSTASLNHSIGTAV